MVRRGEQDVSSISLENGKPITQILEPKQLRKVKWLRGSLHIRAWGYQEEKSSVLHTDWLTISDAFFCLGKFLLRCRLFNPWHAFSLHFYVLWESSSIWHKLAQVVAVPCWASELWLWLKLCWQKMSGKNWIENLLWNSVLFLGFLQKLKFQMTLGKSFTLFMPEIFSYA